MQVCRSILFYQLSLCNASYTNPYLVLWRVTPFLAEWLCNKDNILWTSSLLKPDSNVVELGCGVSGLMALSLAPSVGQYLATDQEYVRKVFKENLAANPSSTARTARPNSAKTGPARRRQNRQKQSKQHQSATTNDRQQTDQAAADDTHANITFVPLDWEVDCPSTLHSYIPSNINNTKAERSSRSPSRVRNDSDASLVKDVGFDLLLGCDCIYNDALIAPFVGTCAEICRLRPGIRRAARDKDMANGMGEEEGEEEGGLRPTICIVAQQLRSHEVFEDWLTEALVDFHVWRVRDDVLGRGAGGNLGFAVHVLVLRDEV